MYKREALDKKNILSFTAIRIQQSLYAASGHVKTCYI